MSFFKYEKEAGYERAGKLRWRNIVLLAVFLCIAAAAILTSGCASISSVSDLNDRVSALEPVVDGTATQTNVNTSTISELERAIGVKLDRMFEKSQYK